jgi:XTP/dITP diphosphohydrolase
VKRLVAASTNPEKIREVRAALEDLAEWTVEALPDGLPDIEETGAAFLDNAILKAVHYSRLVDDLVVADDSGLCVDALGGRPGVHSARYGAAAGERNARLMAELAAAGALDDDARGAAFYCALAVARSGRIVWTVQSELRGRIPAQPAGTGGFGYDPVFWAPAAGKTLAELTVAEKNLISARGQALTALRVFLASR